MPILDTLQKMTKTLLVNVDIPIDTKRLVRISFYPSKIDLVIDLVRLSELNIPYMEHLGMGKGHLQLASGAAYATEPTAVRSPAPAAEVGES